MRVRGGGGISRYYTLSTVAYPWIVQDRYPRHRMAIGGVTYLSIRKKVRVRVKIRVRVRIRL